MPSPGNNPTWDIRDFGAVCDPELETGDEQAWLDFNIAARQSTGLVTLLCPKGGRSNFTTSITDSTSIPGVTCNASLPFQGISNLLVKGYGFTIGSGFDLPPGQTTGGGIRFGGDGYADLVCDYALLEHDALVGDTYVDVDPSKAALFVEGKRHLILCNDLQGGWEGNGFGRPSNAHSCEYPLVTDANLATGRITFSAPLKYDYLVSYPTYDVLNGGAAQLNNMPDDFTQVIEFRGIRIAIYRQWYMRCDTIIFRDCSSVDTQVLGGGGPAPSNCRYVDFINFHYPGPMEVDKLVERFRLYNPNISTMGISSSCPNNYYLYGGRCHGSIKGSSKKSVFSNVKTPFLRVGVVWYGACDELIMYKVDNTPGPSSPTVEQGGNFSPSGVINKGPYEQGVQEPAYRMVDGVILQPVVQGADSPLTVLDHLCFFGGSGITGSFLVESVSRDPWPSADYESATVTVACDPGSDTVTVSSAIFEVGIDEWKIIKFGVYGWSWIKEVISTTQVKTFHTWASGLSGSRLVEFGTCFTRAVTNRTELTDWPVNAGYGGPTGPLYIASQPVQKLTVIESFGDNLGILADLSGSHVSGMPLNSCTGRTFTKAHTGVAVDVGCVGRLEYWEFEIPSGQQYTGPANLHANIQSRFGKSDYTTSDNISWLIDMKTPGIRRVTLSGVTGAVGTDSLETVPAGHTWINGFHMQFDSNVSGGAYDFQLIIRGRANQFGAIT